MFANLEKLLYVVKTRTYASRQTERPLTDQERLEGWYDGAEHDWCLYKDRQNNEGHERGRMHSIPEGHILTWGPEPGDQICAALDVRFKVEHAFQVDENQQPTDRLYIARWLSAKVSREVQLPLDHDSRYVYCSSVLGRAVMLGEDGAEDAFGQDELRRTLEAALEGDWRKVQCAYELRQEPPELRARMDSDFNAAYPDFCKFRDVEIAAPQQADHD